MARRVAKHDQLAEWQINRITGKGAVHIGQVQAPDAEAAIKAAIRKYDIEAKYHDRVAARPIVKAG